MYLYIFSKPTNIFFLHKYIPTVKKKKNTPPDKNKLENIPINTSFDKLL